MTARALLAALAILAAPSAAGAQTGGIQVAPVLVSMTPQHSISSVRVRNGRDRAVAFEIDAYVWTQEGGQDRLTPTNELMVAPGVFEVAASGEQTVRVGVRGADASRETAYRIVIRELPSPNRDGVALGFTLEMSLPVFVSPQQARSQIETSIAGDTLVLTNTGNGFAQVSLFDGDERVPAPRYLLAGSSADVLLPAHRRDLRLVAASAHAITSERTIDVGQQDHSALVR